MLKFRAHYAKKYAGLKKSTLLPVVAVVTYISYGHSYCKDVGTNKLEFKEILSRFLFAFKMTRQR